MIKGIASTNSPGDVVEFDAGEIAKRDFAPRSDWSAMSETDHFVQFYETDGFLMGSLSGFIGTAISSGHAAIVIATPEHR